MQEIRKFKTNIDVILNRLEKNRAFTVDRNLAFTDSKQVINASVDALVEN